MTFVLGLTGGISSGKSTASDFFKKENIPVIDADIISRQVVEPQSEGLEKIVKEFGTNILTENSKLDRKKLGEIIFSNDEKKELLNNILHPIIRKEVIQQKEQLIDENHKLIVLDIPLLYEASYESEVDSVMVVYVNKKVQLERLMGRDNYSKEEALNRINAQIDLEIKKEKADIIIDNNKSLENTNQQIVAWLVKNGYIAV